MNQPKPSGWGHKALPFAIIGCGGAMLVIRIHEFFSGIFDERSWVMLGVGVLFVIAGIRILIRHHLAKSYSRKTYEEDV